MSSDMSYRIQELSSIHLTVDHSELYYDYNSQSEYDTKSTT